MIIRKQLIHLLLLQTNCCYNEFLNKHAAKHVDYYNKKVITLLYLIVFSVCTIEIEHKGLSVPFVFILVLVITQNNSYLYSISCRYPVPSIYFIDFGLELCLLYNYSIPLADDTTIPIKVQLPILCETHILVMGLS